MHKDHDEDAGIQPIGNNDACVLASSPTPAVTYLATHGAPAACISTIQKQERASHHFATIAKNQRLKREMYKLHTTNRRRRVNNDAKTNDSLTHHIEGTHIIAHAFANIYRHNPP